ncbi:Ig-like domain-containing protein [Eubacterium sp.]
MFKTSNKKIVKVSKTGKIKALKKGKAKITVVSGKKKIVCKVTVK